MIQQISVSIRGWHADGRAISTAQFLEILQIQKSDQQVVGQGQPWQAARIILSDLDFTAFNGESEPSEAFAKSLNTSLLAAYHLLACIPGIVVQNCIDFALLTDCFVEVRMDSNQLDLDFPPDFLKELSRLKLSLSIISNN